MNAQTTIVADTIDAAIARWRDAEAAYEAWAADVETPRRQAYQTARDQFPHVETLATFVNVKGDRVPGTTAKPWMVEMAAKIVRDQGDRAPKDADDADFVATMRELVELGRARSLQIDRLAAVHAIGDLVAEAERRSEPPTAALRAVLDFPASTIGDVVRKLAFIEEQQMEDECFHEVAADVRRIGGMS